MGGAYRIHEINAYKSFVRRHQKMAFLLRPRCGWKDNNETFLREMD
jgi:hypothetical protein